MAIGPAHGGEPPEELIAALAGSEERRPGIVRVDVGGATPALLNRAKAKTDIEFVAGAPWHWPNADANAFASAIDLQSGIYDAAPPARKVDPLRVLRPAAWIVATALGIYAFATVGEWLWLQWQSGRTERELVAIAQSAAPGSGGVPPALAISRRLAELLCAEAWCVDGLPVRPSVALAQGGEVAAVALRDFLRDAAAPLSHGAAALKPGTPPSPGPSPGASASPDPIDAEPRHGDSGIQTSRYRKLRSPSPWPKARRARQHQMRQTGPSRGRVPSCSSSFWGSSASSAT